MSWFAAGVAPRAKTRKPLKLVLMFQAGLKSSKPFVVSFVG
jgi:hypothetical protein